MKKTRSQAPSYASESETTTDRLTHSLTGVKCRATSVAKNTKQVMVVLLISVIFSAGISTSRLVAG